MDDKMRRTLYNIYMGLFLIYLLVPLALMGGAAFNDSKLPSVYPWKGLTDRWFIDLWNDSTMWSSFRNTILVALAVVALAVPIGTASAIVVKPAAFNSDANAVRICAWHPNSVACRASAWSFARSCC